MNVLIIDYGIGNIRSVQNGLEKVGATVELSNDPEYIAKADRLVLPGVGAFEAGKMLLKEKGLIKPIIEFVKTGRPLLGICLGMQLLLEKSYEHGEHKGLGLIAGDVINIPQYSYNKQARKVPHIGWSQLISSDGSNDWNSKILDSVPDKTFFYFVHSFMALPSSKSNIVAICKSGDLDIAAIVQNNNVIGCQFHPEKSGAAGLQVLTNFLSL